MVTKCVTCCGLTEWWSLSNPLDLVPDPEAGIASSAGFIWSYLLKKTALSADTLSHFAFPGGTTVNVSEEKLSVSKRQSGDTVCLLH